MNRIDETGVEWVTMTHAGSGGEAEATKTAYEEVWKDKGWTLKDTGADAVVPVGDVPADAGTMRVPEAQQKEEPHA